MVLQRERLYTVEEFEVIADAEENADRLLELIDGEIVEKMPTEFHGQVVLNIGGEFNAYARRTKIGRAGTEVRHRKLEDRYNSRIPDVSFRITSDPAIERGSVGGMPDVAVEIQSPDDDLEKLRGKIRYYLLNGTRLGILVLTKRRIVEVHTKEGVRILSEADTLDGGDVMPGFTMPVKDIFYDPVSDRANED